MNKIETERLTLGLRDEGWSDEEIDRFLYYIKTGEEPFKPEVIDAMKEAKQIGRDPNTKKYDSYSEAIKDLGI
ncbi:MAG: hypothetical protein NC084_04755 [Bacteroides sp.]|nr:hypothetical protein [Eubacterium sp.]MCM1418760.1 hypothetical protein [Roseburia sp.]MCM1462006.1 hypothetical protein [Bacteroides sp.]